jgi:hypothetical protein
VKKTTPLGSYFYCGGLGRLLCLDTTTAKSYAKLAPDVDQIAVLANSTMYGGAGYTDELATVSGGNASAGEILPHEFGHSIGDLADEYPYYAYPGAARAAPGHGSPRTPLR